MNKYKTYVFPYKYLFWCAPEIQAHALAHSSVVDVFCLPRVLQKWSVKHFKWVWCGSTKSSTTKYSHSRIMALVSIVTKLMGAMAGSTKRGCQQFKLRKTRHDSSLAVFPYWPSRLRFLTTCFSSTWIRNHGWLQLINLQCQLWLASCWQLWCTDDRQLLAPSLNLLMGSLFLGSQNLRSFTCNLRRSMFPLEPPRVVVHNCCFGSAACITFYQLPAV